MFPHINRIEKSDKLFIVVFILYIFFQVIFYIKVQEHYPNNGFLDDERNSYGDLAGNLANYGEYSEGKYPNLGEYTSRPPFYPIVLSIPYKIFGKSHLWGIILNNIFLSLTILIIYLIGNQLMKPVGLFAAMIFMMDPMVLKLANTNTSDMLFTVLLALFVFLTAKSLIQGNFTFRNVLLLSLALALATFTRAVGMYVWIIALATFIFTYRHNLKKIQMLKYLTIFLFIQFFIIGGWMARNYQITGNSDYAGMKSTHLYYFVVPEIISSRDKVSMNVALKRVEEGISKDPEYLHLSNGEKQKYRLRIATKIMFENWPYLMLNILENMRKFFFSYPVDALTVFYEPHKLDTVENYLKLDASLRMYNSDRSLTVKLKEKIGILRAYYSNGMSFVLVHGVLMKSFYIIITLSGVAGFLFMLLNKDNAIRSKGFFLCGLIAYIVLVSNLTVQGRFRVPVMPYLSVSAAYFFYIGWTWIKNRRENRLRNV